MSTCGRMVSKNEVRSQSTAADRSPFNTATSEATALLSAALIALLPFLAVSHSWVHTSSHDLVTGERIFCHSLKRKAPSPMDLSSPLGLVRKTNLFRMACWGHARDSSIELRRPTRSSMASLGHDMTSFGCHRSRPRPLVPAKAAKALRTMLGVMVSICSPCAASLREWKSSKARDVSLSGLFHFSCQTCLLMARTSSG